MATFANGLWQAFFTVLFLSYKGSKCLPGWFVAKSAPKSPLSEGGGGGGGGCVKNYFGNAQIDSKIFFPMYAQCAFNFVQNRSLGNLKCYNIG